MLNRYRIKSPIVGSNPIPSATYPPYAADITWIFVRTGSWPTSQPTKLGGIVRVLMDAWVVPHTWPGLVADRLPGCLERQPHPAMTVWPAAGLVDTEIRFSNPIGGPHEQGSLSIVPKRPASIIRRHRNALASAFTSFASSGEAQRFTIERLTGKIQQLKAS